LKHSNHPALAAKDYTLVSGFIAFKSSNKLFALAWIIKVDNGTAR
jgi:hypothetical protein